MNKVIVTILTLGISGFLLKMASQAGESVFASFTVPELRGMSYGEMSETLNDCARKGLPMDDQSIKALVGNLNSSTITPEERLFSICFLYHSRATDPTAVQALTANIGFKTPRLDPGPKIKRWGLYPARDALMNMGTPAAELALESIASNKTETERSLLVSVLRGVLGRDQAVERLEERINKETNTERVAKLKAAVAAMDTPPHLRP